MSTAHDYLTEVEARAEAATSGPWVFEHATPRMHGDCWHLLTEGTPGIRMTVNEYQHGSGNAEFIAATRTDVPRLTAALRAVLELHQQDTDVDEGEFCTCRDVHPCDTRRAVTEKLEVEE